MTIDVAYGDAVSFDADVLILKHAKGLYGVDGAIYRLLHDAQVNFQLPERGAWVSVPTRGSVSPHQVIFIGVGPLHQFGYPQIRDFARTSLAAINELAPDARHVGHTLHGPGYGLDEMEALDSELAGLLDGLRLNRVPPRLTRITIIELDRPRAMRLAARLKIVLPNNVLLIDSAGYALHSSSFGFENPPRKRIFVAMPFRDDMLDVYDAIVTAANDASLTCERADKEFFTDDVLPWVKGRIAAADLVVADITGANPNVYLEIGYAWGLDKRLLIILRDGEEPGFNLRTQRCFVYRSSAHLQEQLRSAFESFQRTLL